jgi:tRNA U34 5-carboxymethylaminomethyl modifying GTPase MnmE/TrmE
MKNKEIYDLYLKLVNTDFNSLKSVKIQYALVKNESILEREAKQIEKTVEKLKPATFVALQEELKALIEKEPEKPQHEIIATWRKKKAYEAAFKEFSKLVEEFDEIETEVKLHLIPMELVDALPEINNSQMKVIFKMIETTE